MHRSTRPAVRLPAVAAAVLVLGAAAAGTASAHDFWLVPDAFALAAGGTVSVRGQTSSEFPTSLSAVTVDRVADARVIGAGTTARITDLSRDGTSLRIRHRPATPGQYVVAVALHPRSVRESAAGFRRYLELEGAPEALARVDREGLLRGRDSVTRRYAKYAKTLVQVGRGADRAFGRSAGHPLEFVPLTDPAALRAGDTLALRLLYRGRPLPAVQVHAGAVDWPRRADVGRRAGATSASAATSDIHLTSDGDGVVRVPLARPGLWNVRTIHVVQAEAGSGADWDTHWATTVFTAAPGSAGRTAAAGEVDAVESAAPAAGSSAASVPASQAGDSADVARTVTRYHQALATGDSAAALALLASDAVVLESGGVETRAEYRGHHLPGDIAFARAVKAVHSPIRVVVRGDAAWASSTSVTQGEFRGRAVNSAGAELMVLTRGTDVSAGWRIAAIHWSSRARRPSPQ